MSSDCRRISTYLTHGEPTYLRNSSERLTTVYACLHRILPNTQTGVLVTVMQTRSLIRIPLSQSELSILSQSKLSNQTEIGHIQWWNDVTNVNKWLSISTDDYKLLNNSQKADNLIDDDLNDDVISDWVGRGGRSGNFDWTCNLKIADNILT